MTIERKLRRWCAVGATAAGLLVAGCGGDDEATTTTSGGGGGGGSEKPATIKVGVALDETGPVGFTGVEGRKAIELAVQEANDNDALGGSTLEVDIQDAATDPKQAANIITGMTRGDEYAALAVGMGSAGALAAAPIAQRAEKPLVVIYAGAPGIVEAGEYVFRPTAPQFAYHHLVAEHFKNEGATTVSQVFANDVPTNVGLAEETWPQLAEENGLELVTTDGFSVTATNFGSVISKIIDANPGAVIMHLAGAQHVTFATALRRAGYEGLISCGAGCGAGTLEPMGKAADGILFPTDFSYDTPTPKGQEFVEKFKAANNGEEPSAFAAAAYDAMQLIIESVKAAPDTSGAAVKDAMTQITTEGFEGTTGPITFEERDARVPGLLVEWRDGAEHVIEP